MYAVEYTWMSEPTKVTTSTITADSGSRRRPKLALNSPELIQSNTGCAIARDPGGRATSCRTARAETTKDPVMAAEAIVPAARFASLRPAPAFSRKPRNGSSGIRSSIDSPLQHRERVGVQRFPMPEQRDHDREPDGRLGGGNGHHEEHDDLPVGGAQRAAEGDKRQVHGVQHDLDRQQ